MNVAMFFTSRGFTSVAGRTYPKTYAIAKKASFLAEQIANRDSATWKKAEHIAVVEIQEDEGRSILPRWKMLTSAEPVGLSKQKLYVAIGHNLYVKYDANGVCVGKGTLEQIV